MKIQALLAAVLLAASATIPAQAGGFSDQVMAPGVLADLPQGRSLRYDHQRRLPQIADPATLPGANRDIHPLEPVKDAGLLLTVDAAKTGPMLRLSAVTGDTARELTSFRAIGPNPVLLFFLENVMRHMAVQTGGNPDYIRNAIRKDLSLAEPEPAGDGLMQVVLHPFADDANGARMGDYQELALTVVWPQDNPGQLVLLEAKAGDDLAGYLESLHLAPEE